MREQDRPVVEFVTGAMLVIVTIALVVGACLSGCYLPNAPKDEIDAMRKMLECEFDVTVPKPPADEKDVEAVKRLRREILNLLDIWEWRLQNKTWLHKPPVEGQR